VHPYKCRRRNSCLIFMLTAYTHSQESGMNRFYDKPPRPYVHWTPSSSPAIMAMGHKQLDFQQLIFVQLTLELHSGVVWLPPQAQMLYSATAAAVVQSRLHDNMNLVQCIISRQFMCDKTFRVVLSFATPSHQILATSLLESTCLQNDMQIYTIALLPRITRHTVRGDK